VPARFIHTQSMRLASGQEALVTRALVDDGTTGYGFSLQLDATEARHMALYQVGLWPERPRIAPIARHPWEAAWIEGEAVPWEVEPAFSRLEWLP
jgi:hypothetical protein